MGAILLAPFFVSEDHYSEAKMDFALCGQALSACDQLEAGLRVGDQDSIQQVRSMVTHWLGDGLGTVENNFSKAFKCLLQKCSEGSLQDLSIVLMAVRCMAETELAKSTGGRDEDSDSGSDDQGPSLRNRAA